MITIGLTGGIGSGKTTVAGIIEVMDIPVYYTDLEAKRIMAESPVVKEELTAMFGEEVYPGGRLNKPYLASLIFNNEANLHYVNSVVHPEVRKDFLQWKEKHTNREAVVVESAILFESGLEQSVDIKVTVTAPLEVRVERVMKRDNVDRQSILDRMANQLTEEERIKRSDKQIVNDNHHALIPQVEDILQNVRIFAR